MIIIIGNYFPMTTLSIERCLHVPEEWTLAPPYQLQGLAGAQGLVDVCVVAFRV